MMSLLALRIAAELRSIRENILLSGPAAATMYPAVDALRASTCASRITLEMFDAKGLAMSEQADIKDLFGNLPAALPKVAKQVLQQGFSELLEAT